VPVSKSLSTINRCYFSVSSVDYKVFKHEFENGIKVIFKTLHEYFTAAFSI